MQRRGFSLLELLVVLAIVLVLSSLGLSHLSTAKKTSRTVVCRGLLSQIGKAIRMYVDDNRFYPPLVDYNTNMCYDLLYPYYPICWTNPAWNCPDYNARDGILSRERVVKGSVGVSYAYNYVGIASLPAHPELRLGLGFRPNDCQSGEGVLVPGEMYAVADARCVSTNGLLAGIIKMHPWFDPAQIPPYHPQGYNVLFCDGHVNGVKWSDFVNPLKTASNWNCDNQPHPEAWADKQEWTK